MEPILKLSEDNKLTQFVFLVDGSPMNSVFGFSALGSLGKPAAVLATSLEEAVETVKNDNPNHHQIVHVVSIPVDNILEKVEEMKPMKEEAKETPKLGDNYLQLAMLLRDTKAETPAEKKALESIIKRLESASTS